MKITVIVPVFQGEKYISRFFGNILNQVSAPTTQLIFIDDGSTDKTMALLDQVSTPDWLQVEVYQQNHFGQSVARNTGINHADGRYVFFLDIDDSFSPNYLSVMTNAMKGKQLAICGINRVLLNGQTKVELDSILQEATDTQEMLKLFLINRTEMDSGLWNKCFDLSIIKQEKLLFEKATFLEDTLFVIKYLSTIQRSQITFVRLSLYNYEQHFNTTTTSLQTKMDSDAADFISKVLSFSGISNPKIRKALGVRTYMYVLHRHILDDPTWTARKQRKFIRNYIFSGLLSSIRLLKYDISIMTAYSLPALYRIMYRQFKKRNQ